MKVSQNKEIRRWWGRLTRGIGGEQQRAWDALGFQLYVLRWLIFAVNLFFGIFGNHLMSVEMLLFYVGFFVVAVLALELLRRRVTIQAVHAVMTPIDVMLISLSVVTSGGLASDTYLLYLVDAMIMTLYLGGLAGVLLSLVTMFVYGWIIFSNAASEALMWQGLYRMAMILMFSVGLAYVGEQLRRQIYSNRQMAEENKRLACTDLLTGLGNSRSFYDRLDRLLLEFQTEGRPFSLLMFDCDNLKKVNDSYGHEAGDLLIREIALTGQQTFEPCGEVMRYAGDEFYALFAECSPATVLNLAEEFVMRLNEHSIRYAGQELHTTASVGLIFFSERPPAKISRSEAIRLADHALYESKKGGKARLTYYKVTAEGE